MDIKAFKMDGLGNDFVIIDQRSQNYNLTKDQIVKICDRNFIGCDQLIFIKKNNEKDAGLEFYNSDGSISGACGNGTRCVADLLSKENSRICSPAGVSLTGRERRSTSENPAQSSNALMRRLKAGWLICDFCAANEKWPVS